MKLALFMSYMLLLSQAALAADTVSALMLPREWHFVPQVCGQAENTEAIPSEKKLQEKSRKRGKAVAQVISRVCIGHVHTVQVTSEVPTKVLQISYTRLVSVNGAEYTKSQATEYMAVLKETPRPTLPTPRPVPSEDAQPSETSIRPPIEWPGPFPPAPPYKPFREEHSMKGETAGGTGFKVEKLEPIYTILRASEDAETRAHGERLAALEEATIRPWPPERQQFETVDLSVVSGRADTEIPSKLHLPKAELTYVYKWQRLPGPIPEPPIFEPLSE